MKLVVPVIFALAATIFAITLTIAFARTRPVELHGWKASLDRWVQRMLEREAEAPVVAA